MNKILKYIGVVFVFIFITSCDEDFKNEVKDFKLNSGEADFTTYVALGNSLTAGFADGTLYQSMQKQSYPAILARMMGQNSKEFKQPYMPDDVGGFSDLFQQSGGTSFYGKLKLNLVNGAPTPVPSQPQNSLENSLVNGDFHNLGVPGAKSYHLLAETYGSKQSLAAGKANPYFVRMATEENTSILRDAMKQKPSFFTLWIGNNDVLGYAMSGASGVNQTGNMDASTYATSDLSDPNLVVGAINTILQKLTSSGAKGAVANIPDVTSIPFFTTVPVKPFSVSNSAYSSQIQILNQSFESLNQFFKAVRAEERIVHFSETESSAPIIFDESLADLSAQISQALVAKGIPQAQAALLASIYGQTRQAKEGDYLILTLSSKLGQVNEERKQALMRKGLPENTATQLSVTGLTNPLKDNEVLTSREVEEIKAVTSKINASISNLASNYGLALVDTHAKMNELKRGMRYNGVNYTTNFISGGAFSLDGVHLNGRGYAIVANEFANSINAKFGSNLPMVNPNNFDGTKIP